MSEFNSVIYSKDSSNCNDDLTHEEVWDDSLLIRHYDEVKAKLDKKKRGRELSEGSVDDTDQSIVEAVDNSKQESHLSSGSSKKRNKRKGKKKTVFKVGDFCRWRYSEDGMIYEAKVAEINEQNGTCTISYLGYENEEIVTTSRLMKSLGENSRTRQISEAEKLGYGSNDSMFGDGSSVTGSDLVSDTDNRANKRKRNTSTPSSYKFPQMPHLPDLPPPPAIGFSNDDPQSEALHTMLMSWYMTGYHTGYFQGLNASRSKHK